MALLLSGSPQGGGGPYENSQMNLIIPTTRPTIRPQNAPCRRQQTSHQNILSWHQQVLTWYDRFSWIAHTHMLVYSLPGDTEHKHRADRGRQERRDSLDVVEQLRYVLDDGNPGYTQRHDHHNKHPAGGETRPVWNPSISWILRLYIKANELVRYLPTIMSSISLAFFLNCLQISMVKIVELLLKMDVSDDIKADIITASMRPRAPSGMSSMTSSG